jgi:hypothetical protein
MAEALSKEALQHTVNVVVRHDGNQTAAAKELGVDKTTVSARLTKAHRLGITPSDSVEDPNNLAHVKQQLKRAQTELTAAQAKALDAETIKRRIIGLKEGAESAEVPTWVTVAHGPDSAPGVPTLFLSDLHWGEVVRSSQINGANRYNMDIASERLKHAADTAVHLLKIISPKMDYPGLVLPLGGDMISGNIHDELATSNEMPTMPTVLDLFGELASLIRHMADIFGKVFLPCVTGNHGRDTQKIWAKDRQHTSFDWLLYCFLAKHFEGDERITFQIPDGPDAYFRIYGHRYLLSHGDQFRGGDGMIGALGPIIRGDHKKRSRNAQIDMEYDTLLLGHWHQYMHLTRLIVNGSLKGYDEYAYSNNFPFEAPQQALWLTHPKHGITFRMPVYVDRARTAKKTAWVSLAA